MIIKPIKIWRVWWPTSTLFILTDCSQSESNFLPSYLAVCSAKFGDVPDTPPTKQPFLDRPGVLEDKAHVEASVSAYGIDEALSLGVGLRLSLDNCIPHQCQCSSSVNACGLHSFVCRRAPGRSARHHALNDLVARNIASAGTP